MIYADIEYSKKLADMFPKSECWWVSSMKQFVDEKHKQKWRIFEKSYITKLDGTTILHEHYPALTTSDLMSKLSKVRQEKAFHQYLQGDDKFENYLAKELLYEPLQPH